MLVINLQLFACTGGSCVGVCSACEGTCGGNCVENCSFSCVGQCFGCTNCTSSCSEGCNSNCSNTCSSCANGCSSCSSCTSSCSQGCNSNCRWDCSGTCRGDCNNGCTSSSASAVIAQLGSNIVQGNTIKVKDFIELRDSIHSELLRRGRPIPNDSYSINPALEVKILVEHQQKIFDDIKVMDSSKFKTINTEATKASTYSEAIIYIKKLMAQNIK